jgi:SAM-dependent methyltransferase
MTAPWYEVAFDRLYPVLYGHRDQAEARRAAKSFQSLFTGGAPVLDLACGNGRYLEAFGQAGVDMRGVDLSGFLLRDAVVTRGLEGRVVRGDMRHLPFRSGTAGGAISMFTSFGYFDTDDDNQRVLNEVARVIAPGGMFLFDFANAGWIVANPPGNTEVERAGYRIEERRSLEGDARYVVKRVLATPLDGGEAVHYEERVRLYRPPELEAMLSAAGLQVTARFGDYDRAGFDPAASRRILLVSERS